MFEDSNDLFTGCLNRTEWVFLNMKILGKLLLQMKLVIVAETVGHVMRMAGQKWFKWLEMVSFLLSVRIVS